MHIIVILRNPIERAYSHWAMELGRGAEQLSFCDALTEEAERCRSALPAQHRVYSYTDRGFYASQIRRLWRFFGRDRVLVLRQEELRHSPQICLDRVCNYLGIAPLTGVEARDRHVGSYQQPMERAARQRLTEMFEPEIRQLEQMLGWDCSGWLEG
nr:sulfotransferase domain-containing protein [Cyanobium sp. WAJ14-Wanaka]